MALATAEIAALRQRLLAGTYTEADLDAAGTLVKGLRDGSITELPEDQPTPAPAPSHGPAPAPSRVETPDPHGLQKALESDPDAKRAINAVPALNAIVKSFGHMAETLAAMEAERTSTHGIVRSMEARLVAMEGGLQKALHGHVAPQAAQAPTQVPVAREQVVQQVGADTERALAKALETSGIMGRLNELDAAVNRRAWTGNPPRAAAPVRKSLAEAPDMTKGDAIALIQKSLDLGRLKDDEAGNAMAQLDIVDPARRQGHEVNYADIVRRFDAKTFEEFAGAA